MRGRGLYLDDLGRHQVLGLFLHQSGMAALVMIGLYAAVKGREGVGSRIWTCKASCKLR